MFLTVSVNVCLLSICVYRVSKKVKVEEKKKKRKRPADDDDDDDYQDEVTNCLSMYSQFAFLSSLSWTYLSY